jgi:hypothetical protein
MQHPEVALPSPGLYKGAVLPPTERSLRAVADDAQWTAVKLAVHSNSSSSSSSIPPVTAFTRRVDKHPLTEAEYDEYIEGCRRGGMFKHYFLN